MAAVADPADPSDDVNGDIAILGQAALLRALDIARQTLFRWRQAPSFPLPLEINGRLYWRRAEIARWLNDQPRRAVGPADSPEALQKRRDWIGDVRARHRPEPAAVEPAQVARNPELPRLGRPRKAIDQLSIRSRRRRLAEARGVDPGGLAP